MYPIPFLEQNCIYAKDQPEYLPLPVHRTADGEVISCWKLTRWERIKVLFLGKLWLRQLTCGDLLQPLLPSVDKPFD